MEQEGVAFIGNFLLIPRLTFTTSELKEGRSFENAKNELKRGVNSLEKSLKFNLQEFQRNLCHQRFRFHLMDP